jgi:hypothetical protein
MVTRFLFRLGVELHLGLLVEVAGAGARDSIGAFFASKKRTSLMVLSTVRVNPIVIFVDSSRS